jgi:hypothetical protein
VHRLAAELFEQLVAEVLQDRRGLALASRGADDEVVGDERDGANVEEDNVAGLLVRSEIDNPPREVERVGAVPCRARFAGDV